ncbi:MAG: LuxR C-terminal-related transcriptional regulator [Pseudanabaena sp.]|jgi:DNA-binding NarL/FixJ family response regulator|uniref:response regulator transcription factor n=1 Tax=Pseudanabaena mucicola TaxID=71190 RepID=UPI000E9C281B|nr:response regulator transcription factor [Pseudanabaena mucicola]MCA6575392.1 response regulator transcription factor [Pseudanabaena sp. M53BS1SP1A06MG]MCA6584703.1 response regulator transcription factor [Pseudanabaena sp. M34BS1SP1A06MG]MCA6586072.1 response regulator transcription factor [Pseudanabaena sp. M051S1SP1A06QC]MCA6588889.1 response regulator transcription factor [Pseudanabaena sp. M109S1SP1A06QC]MCA6596526.1 response regulator transcription factor [Pseudanabaena sp. M046S1SP1A0
MTTTAQVVSVLLVENDSIFRRGLHTLLSFYSDDCYLQFQIVGEATSSEQAIKLVIEQKPALILLDVKLALELSEDSGLKVLMDLKKLDYHGKALILSAHREDELVFRAMQLGARGYVAKDRIGSQLYDAISTVMNDEIFLPPDIATSFFRIFHFYAGRSLQGHCPIHLTDREQEVLNWLIKGASNEEISRYLHVSIATVKAHLTSVFEKLGVTSRTQAIVKALKLGLVGTDE